MDQSGADLQVKRLHAREWAEPKPAVKILRPLPERVVESGGSNQPMLGHIPFAENQMQVVVVRRIVMKMGGVEAGFEIKAVGTPWLRG